MQQFQWAIVKKKQKR